MIKEDNDSKKVLAFIYTFYPNVDTSGNVFAKRLCAEIQRPTIVVTNRYISNPPVDESLSVLVKPYLFKRIEIDSPFTYRDWEHFEKYIDGAVDVYKSEIAKGIEIDTIYSRSMSVITHLAAYKLKKENPHLKWIAEFSDPIIKDVDGSERKTVIPNSWILKANLNKYLQSFDDNRNLFFVSEILVYLFADEIIFTNDQQKKYMTQYLLEKTLNLNIVNKLLSKIEDKSVVKVHPTLDKKYYALGKYKENVDKSLVNIGYFGNINSNRNFNELFDAWLSLEASKRTKVRLYVYTNMNADNILKNVPVELHPYLYIKKGLNYLDYLGVLDSFTYLLTIDTRVSNIFGINPFLPSKISDYLGSNSKILAILDKASPTSYINSSKIIKKHFADNIFEGLV